MVHYEEVAYLSCPTLKIYIKDKINEASPYPFLGMKKKKTTAGSYEKKVHNKRKKLLKFYAYSYNLQNVNLYCYLIKQL